MTAWVTARVTAWVTARATAQATARATAWATAQVTACKFKFKTSFKIEGFMEEENWILLKSEEEIHDWPQQRNWRQASGQKLRVTAPDRDCQLDLKL